MEFQAGGNRYLTAMFKQFPRYWSSAWGIHRSVDSPHKGQWLGTLMFSLYVRLKKTVRQTVEASAICADMMSMWRHCNGNWKIQRRQHWLKIAYLVTGLMSLTASLVTTSRMQWCINVFILHRLWIPAAFLYSVGNTAYYRRHFVIRRASTIKIQFKVFVYVFVKIKFTATHTALFALKCTATLRIYHFMFGDRNNIQAPLLLICFNMHVIISIIKSEVKLPNHSQTSTSEPLKFGNW